MTAGRHWVPASLGLAVTCCLLAVISFSGCTVQKSYIRRGEMLDSLALRSYRMEQQQQRIQEELNRTRADLATELQLIVKRLDQLDARMLDQDQRIGRIGRRLGVWHEAAVPADSGAAVPDSVTVLPDTQPVSVLVDSARTGIDPDQLYATAYLDFTREQYNVSIAGFRQYLQMFPDTDLSDNAQYWIGECYHSVGNLPEAEAEFKRVLSDHPNGNKIPAAEYKLGLVYAAMGRPDDARQKFETVVRKYPGTPEARLAQDRLTPEPE